MDIFGICVFTFTALVFAWRRNWLGVVVIALGGLWLFGPRLAYGDEFLDCDRISKKGGYWAVSGEDTTGNAEHNYGNVTNSIEVRADELSFVHDTIRATLVLNPAANWGDCAEVAVRFNYSLGITDNYGGWLSGNAAWVGIDTFATSINSAEGVDNDSITTGARPGREIGMVAQITGHMAGWASISPSAFPVAPPRLSDRIKKQYRVTGNVMDFVGNLTAASAAAVPDKVLAVVVSLFGIATKRIAQEFRDVADKDPWNASYKKVYSPRIAAMPAEIRGATFRALYKNLLTLDAYLTAAQISTDRANTAMAVGDERAEDRQQGAIERYARKIAKLCAQQATLRLAVAKKLPVDTSIADVRLIDELIATSVEFQP